MTAWKVVYIVEKHSKVMGHRHTHTHTRQSRNRSEEHKMHYYQLAPASHLLGRIVHEIAPRCCVSINDLVTGLRSPCTRPFVRPSVPNHFFHTVIHVIPC